MTRRNWVEPVVGIAVSHQCLLVGVARSTIYAGHRAPVVSEDDLLICRLIDAEYTEHPFGRDGTGPTHESASPAT